MAHQVPEQQKSYQNCRATKGSLCCGWASWVSQFCARCHSGSGCQDEENFWRHAATSTRAAPTATSGFTFLFSPSISSKKEDVCVSWRLFLGKKWNFLSPLSLSTLKMVFKLSVAIVLSVVVGLVLAEAEDNEVENHPEGIHFLESYFYFVRKRSWSWYM